MSLYVVKLFLEGIEEISNCGCLWGGGLGTGVGEGLFTVPFLTLTFTSRKYITYLKD